MIAKTRSVIEIASRNFSRFDIVFWNTIIDCPLPNLITLIFFVPFYINIFFHGIISYHHLKLRPRPLTAIICYIANRSLSSSSLKSL